MIELLRHLTGVCGEHWHPNFLNMSMIAATIMYSFNYIKLYIHKIYNGLKSYNLFNTKTSIKQK